MREFMAFCDLRADLQICLATLHNVRTLVLVLQTCLDLRQLASPFGQGFSHTCLTPKTMQCCTYQEKLFLGV